MNNKYLIYAVFVTVVSTWTSWSGMFKSSVNRGGGSSWSSGGGGYGGSSGGGHK